MVIRNEEKILLTWIIKQNNCTILIWILTDIVHFHSIVLWRPIIIKIMWKHLVAKRVPSRTMTKKIAGRGSNFYLELAQKKNPDGIHVFLNEVHDGSFRVKRSKKIIESNNLSNTHQWCNFISSILMFNIYLCFTFIVCFYVFGCFMSIFWLINNFAGYSD